MILEALVEDYRLIAAMTTVLTPIVICLNSDSGLPNDQSPDKKIRNLKTNWTEWKKFREMSSHDRERYYGLFHPSPRHRVLVLTNLYLTEYTVQSGIPILNLTCSIRF
ncbi:MAG: hypothetical protein EA001_15955 [Oscillatoriales cyanobacterium]|nr:MAG: hypothetical protein EA001_15955 [Oscillatoriales cyanobacterium]